MPRDHARRPGTSGFHSWSSRSLRCRIAPIRGGLPPASHSIGSGLGRGGHPSTLDCMPEESIPLSGVLYHIAGTQNGFSACRRDQGLTPPGIRRTFGPRSVHPFRGVIGSIAQFGLGSPLQTFAPVPWGHLHLFRFTCRWRGLRDSEGSLVPEHARRDCRCAPLANRQSMLALVGIVAFADGSITAPTPFTRPRTPEGFPRVRFSGNICSARAGPPGKGTHPADRLTPGYAARVSSGILRASLTWR